jgi:hypothetical protein
MTEHQLGMVLKDMYENAKDREGVLQTHLFGIKYANEIESNSFKISEIVRESGLNKSYVTEINKGINLAKYVTLKIIV